MDRELERQNKEAINRTMLMQEETFKSQVIELHRVHAVQTKLMEELEVENPPVPNEPNTNNPELHDLQGGREGDDRGLTSGNTSNNLELKNPTLEDLSLAIAAIKNQLSSGSRDTGLEKVAPDSDLDEKKNDVNLTLSLPCSGATGSSSSENKSG